MKYLFWCAFKLLASDVILFSTLCNTLNSIRHEYKDWDDKNPQLATCNKDTKISMQGNTVPQEVGTDKDIVFSYDVSFKVFTYQALAYSL